MQDLARLLTKMGAQVDGIGSNVMTVNGRDKLGGAEHDVCPDHIEIASFMALAAATGGELRIRDMVPDDLEGIRRHFRRLGLQTMVEDRDLMVPPEQKLTVRDDQGDAIPKIDDGPWPAFPADLTSIALALATQADGTILIFEKMFENRLFFVDKLVAMGARITLCDPHRAIVSGPSRLHGERLESPDIRAGMAMLIAALAADGTSEIGNVVQIDRGYERIDLRLRELGARIDRVSAERVTGLAGRATLSSSAVHLVVVELLDLGLGRAVAPSPRTSAAFGPSLPSAKAPNFSADSQMSTTFILPPRSTARMHDQAVRRAVGVDRFVHLVVLLRCRRELNRHAYRHLPTSRVEWATILCAADAVGKLPVRATGGPAAMMGR